MGSLGFFWWYIPDQIEKYYEKILDLETNSEVGIERTPKLKLDWGRGVLDEKDLKSIAIIFMNLPGSDNRSQHAPFDEYLTGLGFLGKSDIHMQFEINSFAHFYHSLKIGMQIYNKWDGKSSYCDKFDEYFKTITNDADEQKKYGELIRKLENGMLHHKDITLTEVGVMKIMCDAFFNKLFNEMVNLRIKEERSNNSMLL